MKSNASELTKYGNLNFNCDPALQLLFIIGFSIKDFDNRQRLIWNNTPTNLQLIKDIHSILSLDTAQLEAVVSSLRNGFTYKDAMSGLDTYKVVKRFVDENPRLADILIKAGLEMDT